MPHKISLLTLVHRRPRHLENLLIGLQASTRLPDELIVIYMNEPKDYPLPHTDFPIRSVHLRSNNTKIPLAQARNLAVSRAHYDLLIFLDVDCIPEQSLVARYAEAANHSSGLMMGEVRYLPSGATEPSWTFDQLNTTAVPHPARPAVHQRVQPEDRYELFWTLNFAIHRSTFKLLEGFDEHYQGYGAEDTDFAFTARDKGVSFALCQAGCFHQHHSVYRPPLQHFADIVANAQRFYHKWRRWPMEGWLGAFQAMGLITWRADLPTLVICRPPSSDEIAAAYYEAPAGF